MNNRYRIIRVLLTVIKILCIMVITAEILIMSVCISGIIESFEMSGHSFMIYTVLALNSLLSICLTIFAVKKIKNNLFR